MSDPIDLLEERARRGRALAGPAGIHELHDAGNSERLARRHGENIRYVPEWVAWIIWDGERWMRDEGGEILQLARDTAKAIYLEAAEADSRDASDAISKHARRSLSEARLRSMISLGESEPGMIVHARQLDADPWKLVCRNGTLDLRTGQLAQSARADLATRIAPVAYDPDTPAPTWLAFLAQTLGDDQDLITWIQRAVGYSLTGDTSEQVFFLLWGTGANGKSTFLDAIRYVMGDYALQTPYATFLAKVTPSAASASNDIARLDGARLVAAVEADPGRRLDEPLVKALTGGDAITARYLYREYFEFYARCKLWLAANHKPRITGGEHAIWRRTRLVPFTRTVPPERIDRELPERLRDEAAGILAWAVRGCLDWQLYGLGNAEAVEQATEDYRVEMDDLGSFIAERCILGDSLWAAAKDLYSVYVSWSEENRQRPMSAKNFGQAMQERGLESIRTKTERRWRGLGLADRGHHEAAELFS